MPETSNWLSSLRVRCFSVMLDQRQYFEWFKTLMYVSKTKHETCNSYTCYVFVNTSCNGNTFIVWTKTLQPQCAVHSYTAILGKLPENWLTWFDLNLKVFGTSNGTLNKRTEKATQGTRKQFTQEVLFLFSAQRNFIVSFIPFQRPSRMPVYPHNCNLLR